MARQDFSKLLGKRVGYVAKLDDEPAVYFTGYILGYMQYAEGAEVYDEIHSRGDILFLCDNDNQNNLKAHFIGSDYDFHLIE